MGLQKKFDIKISLCWWVNYWLIIYLKNVLGKFLVTKIIIKV
tara:strand:- start:93 stop:218 length:126 start_codon:yes stop_codon:yes gene_type:complete